TNFYTNCYIKTFRSRKNLHRSNLSTDLEEVLLLCLILIFFTYLLDKQYAVVEYVGREASLQVVRRKFSSRKELWVKDVLGLPHFTLLVGATDTDILTLASKYFY
ncbi:unnamed protein product, partial [Amoebophrya sp. A25]